MLGAKKTGIKTLREVNLQNAVPYLHQKMKTVQDTIPVQAAFADGIFLLDNGNYSASWRFADVNYNVAADADKKSIFFGYGDLISGLPEGVSSKITLFNRKRDGGLLGALQALEGENRPGDLIQEYNQYLEGLVSSGNGIVQDKYITINAAGKSDVREARNALQQTGAKLDECLSAVGSVMGRLSLNERLRVLHDFYRYGEEEAFRFDPEDAVKKGYSFKEEIAPVSIRIEKDYLELGGLYAQAMFLSGYGSYVSDDMISELCKLDRPMMLSIDVIPIPLQEAVEEAQRRYEGVESTTVKYRQKQYNRKTPGAPLPYRLEMERKQTKEVLDDLQTRGENMFVITVSLVHLASSLEELQLDGDTLKTTCAQRHSRLDILTYQQLDGLNTVMPYGQIHVPFNRSMMTDPAAALMPFSAQEICDRTGIPYGTQAVSGNLLAVDRLNQDNGNGFILGVSGAGKSFVAKKEINFLRMKYWDAVDILIIDPQGEYEKDVVPLGASVIDIASGGDVYINAMDLEESYDNKNPLALKSEYLITLVEQMVGEDKLTAVQRSVLDDCIGRVYRPYIRGKYKGEPPTLVELSQMLQERGGTAGKELAAAIGLYTTGTLDIFARRTNVDMKNPLTLFCTREIGENLKPLAMFVILDAVLNRVSQNFLKGRTTYIYIDEIYLMFLQEYTAVFFYKLWKQIRKFGGLLTGMTQNVEECLASLTARAMIGNSDFLIMLRQAPKDEEKLAEMLKISEVQLGYVRSAKKGCGLMKVGSAIVPFVDEFPENTRLFQLMNTDPRKRAEETEKG